MTVNEAKAKLCTWALSQVDYREGRNNNNRYADTPGLSTMYGWNPQNQPWCDVFVDSGFIECFGLNGACAMTYQPIGAGSALCRQSAQYYKDAGAWSMRPEIGDQVFFYVSGDINHTGIVVGVDGGSVTTVEGNSSDRVAERTYAAGAANIAGYGRPKWSAVSDSDTPSQETPGADPYLSGGASDPAAEDAAPQRFYTLRLPYLRYGSKGAAVEAAQAALIGHDFSCGPDGADGDFGGNTRNAVRAFQHAAGLEIDGKIGPDTGAVLYGGEA